MIEGKERMIEGRKEKKEGMMAGREREMKE